MRIGIDLGGTKIEALALDDAGVELARHRVDTPRDDYDGTLGAMVDLVRRIEQETGRTGTVGAGIPGSLRSNGLVKNANSTWLNGRPLREDLGQLLKREVRVANDANCLAVSEATDGAARGMGVVFAVILGTGCGGGRRVGPQSAALGQAGRVAGSAMLLRPSRLSGGVGLGHRHRAGLRRGDRTQADNA
jgi:fructokinase